jgi:hypothetical protein
MFVGQVMLDPKTALDAYQSSCQTKAHRIAQFMAGRKGFDLSRKEAEHLDDMIGVMVDQIDAMEDLWEDIIEIVNQYPVDINNDTLVTEWSGTITSTRRIVNRVLGTSDGYSFVDPNTLGLDGYDVFFSAGEHVDNDIPNDDVATEKDDINGANHEAGASINVKPDENFQPNGDGVGQERNGVVQQRVGLDYKSLLENLQQQWNHKSGMGLSRRSAYKKINRIVDFIDRHRGAEVTRKELEELNNMERSLSGRWNEVLHLIEDDRNAINTNDHTLVLALGMAVGYTRRNTERFAREAIRTEQTPVVSQTAPDDVTDDAREAARLELACVRTWVEEEDTRESVREATRFPHDGEAVIKPDVLVTEVDIRTVAVTESA